MSVCDCVSSKGKVEEKKARYSRYIKYNMNTVLDKRRLSEEEADAEIERIQQRITLALQQIDENFATCNQIVTSRIGPGIDQYGEASQQVWDFSKVDSICTIRIVNSN